MLSRTLKPVSAILFILALCGCNPDANLRDMIPWNRYFVASTAMAPTLPKDAKFVARNVSSDAVKRGDVLVVEKGQEEWVFRLIALPGDRIAVEGGAIVLNGERIEQRPSGAHRITVDGHTQEFAKLRETLPDMAASYSVLDAGPSTIDDMAEVALADDQFFLMGDNRDHAADSRSGEAFRGLGIVAGAQIKRRVDLDSLSR